VIDNLLSATIITGTLQRLVVSPTSNVDLFNALRGGGSNFGVVTSFTYRAHEQKNMIWIGVVKMPFPSREEHEKEGGSDVEKLMQAIQKWYAENGRTNTDASCVIFFGWPLGEVRV
jgi:FAD/FMN-containing dehydrogenase